jgi:hypothetical protein
MSGRALAPERGRAMVHLPAAGHADVLDDWLGASTRPDASRMPRWFDYPVDWEAPCYPVELAYDTADQGLPSGVRAVIREGNRRLMFEAKAYEIVLRVATNHLTMQCDVAGQVLFEGLPLPGAILRLELECADATTSTDGAGGFRFPPLPHGAYRVRIAVDGAVLMTPPIVLH